MATDVVFYLSSRSSLITQYFYLILFFSGFSFLCSAVLTKQVATDKFLPENPKILLMAALFGALIGSWYGYASHLGSYYLVSCDPNKSTVELHFAFKTEKINTNTEIYIGQVGLVGYRGGSVWIYSVFSGHKEFSSVAISIKQLKELQGFMKGCGFSDYKFN